MKGFGTWVGGNETKCGVAFWLFTLDLDLGLTYNIYIYITDIKINYLVRVVVEIPKLASINPHKNIIK